MKYKGLVKFFVSVLVLVALASTASAQSTLTADVSGTNFVECQPVNVAFNGSPVAPTAPCCNSGTSGSWALTGTNYQWTGKLSNPTNSGSAILDTTTTSGTISATCLVTYTYTCSCTSGTTSTTDTATAKFIVGCPTETISVANGLCGQTNGDYGAIATYTYVNTNQWWFKENVVLGKPCTCLPGATLVQTKQPFQAAADSMDSISDTIELTNGPPSLQAPCTQVTKQTVFGGPTQARVQDCSYSHTQTVQVAITSRLPRAGTVTTSVNNQSTPCNW